MSKKRRLGRGLEALLGVGNPPDAEPEGEPGKGIAEGSALDPPVDNDKVEESTDESPDILPFTPNTDPRASGKPGSGQGVYGPQNLETVQESPGAQSISIPTDPAGETRPAQTGDQLAGNQVPSGSLELNVYEIDDNPFQPRREFNKSEIESLAESLKTHEQLQPILVRKAGDRYQLISGERRLRAAIQAGWSKIQAQVREADDRLVAELAIVENLQRKDLNPIEKALSFRRYIDEHGCSQDDLAGRLKIDRSTIANLLRLLELPSVVQKALQVALISNGHARALLPLGEEHLQIEFCNRVQREGLSVRAVEQLVREKIDQEDGVKPKPGAKTRTQSGQILSLEKELRNALGTRVEIKPSSRGKGKITVHYSSREEFERLRQFFCDPGGSQSVDAA